MCQRRFRAVSGFTLLLVGLARLASAQQIQESIGSRALGMGGAFTAVADDSSAVYWNPAGLATGSPAGLTIGWSQFRTGDQSAPPSVSGPTSRTAFTTSLGFLPAAISYAHFGQSLFVNGPGGLVTRSADVSQYAFTLLQTVTPGVVVGGNLKYLRATTLDAPPSGSTAAEAFGAASTSGGRSTNAFDVDLGVMINAQVLRIGFVARNLRQPKFALPAGSATPDSIELQRTARVGVAVLPTHGLTLAMDMDLVTLDLADGPRRMIAFGAEEGIGQHVQVRGGVRWSLVNGRHPAGTGGVSVQVRPNLWIDGHFTRGSLLADRGFGGALRVGL